MDGTGKVMIKIGDKIPAFKAINQEGETVSSEQFLGKKLVLFFYPKASTPGCTAQACNLSENYEILQKQGYNVLGISADDVKRQKNFHTKNKLTYDLIADTEKEIIEKFGVWQLKKFMGKEYFGIVRTTFLFDENSICTNIIEKVKTKAHAEQILA